MEVANISVDYKELDDQSMTMMEKREGTWTCKVCGKTDDKLNRKTNFQKHVESLLIPATLVGKISGIKLL